MNASTQARASRHIGSGCLIVCRNEFTADLAGEICVRLSIKPEHVLPVPGFGAVVIDPASCEGLLSQPVRPFVFERQRIESAIFIQRAPVRQMAREILSRVLPPITVSNASWVLHAYAADSQSESDSLARPVAGLAEVFLETCKERFTRVYRRRVFWKSCRRVKIPKQVREKATLSFGKSHSGKYL